MKRATSEQLEDELAHCTDPATRRRLQNRIAQRTHSQSLKTLVLPNGECADRNYGCQGRAARQRTRDLEIQASVLAVLAGLKNNENGTSGTAPVTEPLSDEKGKTPSAQTSIEAPFANSLTQAPVMPALNAPSAPDSLSFDRGLSSSASLEASKSGGNCWPSAPAQRQCTDLQSSPGCEPPMNILPSCELEFEAFGLHNTCTTGSTKPDEMSHVQHDPMLASTLADSANNQIPQDSAAPISHVGLLPLHCALLADKMDILEMLLSAGADPNAPDQFGNPPLHFAISHGRGRFISVLLDHGADPNVQDSSGQNSLHLAVIHGTKEWIQTLCSKGADPNARDANDRMPLHIAISQGDTECVKCLLEAGAKPIKSQ